MYTVDDMPDRGPVTMIGDVLSGLDESHVANKQANGKAREKPSTVHPSPLSTSLAGKPIPRYRLAVGLVLASPGLLDEPSSVARQP